MSILSQSSTKAIPTYPIQQNDGLEREKRIGSIIDVAPVQELDVVAGA